MAGVSFHIHSQPPRVIARCDQEERVLPPLWLRERCQDPEHLDPYTRQRLFNPHALPEDLSLTAAERVDADRVWLSFSDGYRGCFELAPLEADFDPCDRLPPLESWDARLDRDEVTFDWPGLDDDEGMLAALDRFLARGFLVLRNVPTDPDRILEVARAFGHPRETNFGMKFEVFSRPASNDLAYSSVALGPHTDNPYRAPVPGIQLLHCLVNEVRGGYSTLADGLAAGSALAKEDPEAFERLAATPVRFRFIDADGEFIERRPIIQRNGSGEMTGLHYSPRLDYMPLLEEAHLRAFHRARRRLGELLTDSAREIRFPLRSGELLIFDNSRIVHGRTAYDPNEGRRHLQGCYIDLDEPRSRYRVLSRRIENHPADVESS